jgi:outer membrane protein
MIKKITITTIFVIYVCALTSITGCRTLKSPSGADEYWTPPKWEKSSRSTDEVWKSLRERKVDDSRLLALPELVAIALKNNPSISQALQDAIASQMKVKQAESSWLPKITISGDFTKDKKKANQKVNSLNTRSYGGGAEADLLAFDLGGRQATVKEAYQTLLAANFNFNQAVLDVILLVEKSYFSYMTAKASLEAAEANTEDAKTAYYVADQKFKVGIASKLDALQGKSTYDQSLFLLEEARGNVRTSRSDLAVAMGLTADTAFEAAPATIEISEELTKKDVTELIEIALKKRPDVAASRANLRAKEAAVTVANSDLWPTLNLGGTAQKRWTEYFGDNKAYQDFYEYTAFVKVNWEVFDGFNLYAKKREAQAEAKSERASLTKDELSASADVWTKYYDFKTALSKLTFSEAFLASSRESHGLALESYKAGLKSILDLLQSQSQLADARSKFVQSTNGLYVSYAELAHAMGLLGIKGGMEHVRGGP